MTVNVLLEISTNQFYYDFSYDIIFIKFLSNYINNN